MRALFQTDDGWTGLILRLTLGLVMLPHGAQKLLGWFGGKGFDGTIRFFTQNMGCHGSLLFLWLSASRSEAWGSWLGFSPGSLQPVWPLSCWGPL